MKKWIAWALILTLLLGGTSCKKAGGEEGAASGEYVEGNSQNLSGDTPDKVTDWETGDLTGSTGTPSTQTPGVQDNEEEQPDNEQQEQETPEEEQQQEENPSQPEQKPEENPEPEEEQDQPVTQPEQIPTQPEETPEEDDYVEEPEDSEEEPEEDKENDSSSATLRPVTKPTVTVDPKANELKIISYNVRTSNDGEGKNVADRAPRFKKAMDQYDPDIMGLQEVSSRWMPYLEEYFSDEYDYIHRWRAEDSKEGTPLFWKKDKFTCLEGGYFWLSDTPDKESKAENWGAKHYRICVWAKLRVKSTGKIFLFYNTHFDTADSAELPSANLILQQVSDKGGFNRYPVFCTGDFNMYSTAEAYKKMCERFHDINCDLNNDKTPTYTSYGTKAGSIIDFCFYSPGLVKPMKYKVITELVDGGHISDHYGLYIEAKLL